MKVKVLTIKEPFASLIKEKIKKIETRSWKTNYRGEIYINAGLAKITKDILKRKELVKLTKNITPQYGNIICKAKLVDCIYMDKNFIERIKKDKQEYVCGRYEEGRYAWVLDDIEVIKPIPVKGQLGIWNYNMDE